MSPPFLPHPAVGSHQRRLSHDTPLSLRRSTSGLRSRWVARGIPEAYEIKVYEIAQFLNEALGLLISLIHHNIFRQHLSR